MESLKNKNFAQTSLKKAWVKHYFSSSLLVYIYICQKHFDICKRDINFRYAKKSY